MELVEVVLYVRDMEQAIHFYRDVLGLELDFESAGWTTFRTPPASIRRPRTSASFASGCSRPESSEPVRASRSASPGTSPTLALPRDVAPRS